MVLTDHITHRPFPFPKKPWVMHQAWNDFLFLHWEVDPDQVRAAVPEPLELHLHNGKCWLGIIPFHMTDVRPRGTLNVPGVSAFPELNVRTYVIADGKPGVYFLSLDAHNRLAVETARLTYDLPYFSAEMAWERKDDTIHYRSCRMDSRGPDAELVCHHTPRGSYRYTEEGSLEKWLSERYCLHTVSKSGAVYTTDVHHLPWPIRDAEVHLAVNTMAVGHGIDISGDPHVMYSPGVDVVIWTPRRIS